MINLIQLDQGIEEFYKAYRNPRRAVSHLQKIVSKPHLSLSLAYSSRYGLGTPIWEFEWDLLVILDTCRVDALREVAPEYEFLSQVESIRSVGGSSPEWIASTFSPDYRKEIADTAYLACNGWAQRILVDRELPEEAANLLGWTDWDIVTADDIGKLEHIWKYEPQDERGKVGHREGHSPPRYVTDRTVANGRKYSHDRIIAHYNQPHAPYTSNAFKEGRSLKEYERNPFKYLQRTGNLDIVWDSYLDDLRYVLDDVEILLENIDARTVILTADHGEAFGEYGAFGHTCDSLNPYVRRVSWVKTTAADTGDYQPTFDPISSTERSVEKTLRALGYR